MKFRTTFFSLLRLCIFAVMFACSQGPGDLQVQTQGPSEKAESLMVSKLNQQMKNFSIDCPAGTNCPNYLGLVVAADEKRTWRCSGFLIDGDTLMTAEHCLPHDLKKLHQSCDGRLFFKLPKIDNQNYQEEAETLECDKVIGFEPMSWRAYDFVVIKLKGASKRSLYPRLNFENRFHGQALKIWKADHLNDRQSVIAQTSCALNNRSLLSLYFQDPRSSQIQYGGCETNAGNSGAPVLNAQNEIIGIHSSSTKETSPISSILADMIPNGRAQEFSAATNLGCLCQQETSEGKTWRSCPQYNSCLSPATTENLYLNRLSLLDRAVKNFRFPLLENKKTELVADPNGSFGWETHLSFQESRLNGKTQFQLLLSLKPVCLKRSVDPSTLSSTGPIYLDIPLCKAQVSLNGQFEIMDIKPTNQNDCQKINLELVRTNSEYLDYRALYFKEDGTRSNLSPITEIFSLPYCR